MKYAKDSKKSWVLGVMLGISAMPVHADQFHYNNFLIGDRAVGLGGAYTGVSDDASGIYYNPAGLAFALSNDVSGSANAFYKRTVKYKKTIGGDDFTERSGGSLPSFFGGLQKIDNVRKGLVFAFGVYTTDSELKDQDDTVKDKTLSVPSGYYYDNNGNAKKDSDGNYMSQGYCYNSDTSAKGLARPNILLKRFHRTVNERGSSYMAGGALGMRVSNNLSFGMGLNYVTVDELVQEYQDTRNNSSVCKSDGTYAESTFQLAQNIRQSVGGVGFQSTFGLQYSFLGRFSAGFVAKLGKYLSQSLQQSLEKRTVEVDSSDQASIDTNSLLGKETVLTSFGKIVQIANKTELKKRPLGSMPSEYRAGLAWFASTRLLVATDISYIGSVTDTEKIAGVINLFDKDSVTNFSIGAEYYLLPAVPLRMGYFTNRDARPSINKSKANQRDHFDYQGLTSFLAWVQPNSQIGAGVVVQQGSGQAQKIGGTVVQEVDARSFIFAFSATHSF